MTTSLSGVPLRDRPPASGRRLLDPIPDRLRQNREHVITVASEPYRGITTDGNVIPDLFAIQKTGVSTRQTKDAADKYWSLLTQEQQAAGGHAIDANEWRMWYNTSPCMARHGVLLESLNDAQRTAALDVIQASLSARGFETARNVMRLNETIREMTERWDEYGEWVYFFTIYGTPSMDEPWGWQIDGHHLIISYFVLGDQVVMTPTFMGSEPILAESGKYAGTRVFEGEEHNGLELMRGLSQAQQDKAILFRSVLSTDLPAERYETQDGRNRNGALRDNNIFPYEGVRADSFSAAQQDLLLQLVRTYAGRMRPGHDEVKMDEVRRHLDETYFAWMGGFDEDDVFYYKVQSPVIIIEFDHQRGVAFEINEPYKNHIHTIVRTPNGNDYGRDLLRQHYERHHQK